MPKVQNLTEPFCVYIPPDGREMELQGEIKNILFAKDRFLIAKGHEQKTYWAQNIWKNARIEKIESIKKAVLFLKAIQRNWWHFPLENVRRGILIQEQLPRIKDVSLTFPHQLSSTPMGAFTLLSENELLYSAHCSSDLPNGEYNFADADYETPSLAYKKLWEALTRMQKFPTTGDLCVDIGSAPGYWTQALLKMGARVVSLDRSELEIPAHENLQFIKGNAFTFKPEVIENPSWIFSDIICYPDKLYELAKNWKKVHPHANYVFTIKFQKTWDKKIVELFEKIPNSKVVHLFHNKHELCWICGK